jgi:hypothetical protein
LNPEQRRCLLLNLLDAVLAAGARPEDHALFMRVMAALGTTIEQMRPYMSLFPQ